MNQKGITLVELIVAMAIAGVIGWVVVSTFTNMNRAVIDQNTVVDVQSTGRNAVALMVRILRETGLDPLGIADAGMEEATATKLRITRDVDLNGLIEEGLQERVTFEFTAGRLRRCYDEGTAVETCSEMSDDVQNLTFDYPDANTINITLTLQEEKADKQDFTRTLSTTVQGRNP
jgi:prepilin-type N-terminal cleavage/methylation domain-containing protein